MFCSDPGDIPFWGFFALGIFHDFLEHGRGDVPSPQTGDEPEDRSPFPMLVQDGTNLLGKDAGGPKRDISVDHGNLSHLLQDPADILGGKGAEHLHLQQSDLLPLLPVIVHHHPGGSGDGPAR